LFEISKRDFCKRATKALCIAAKNNHFDLIDFLVEEGVCVTKSPVLASIKKIIK
jgi:hypothetical protein